MPAHSLLGQRAIVLGASMGGLLAARVLHDHFGEVVLVERDSLTGSGHRKGVPQSRHTHALLARGGQILERLFPKITGELVAEGAVLADALGDARRFIGGGYYCRPQCGRKGILVSRPLLEAHVRQRLLALPNIRLKDEHDVLGVEADGAERVTGARIAPVAGAASGETVPADLVVDATGRGSKSPAWLTALGYEAPAEEKVQIGLGYSTRIYRRTPEHLGGALTLMITPTPASLRAAIVLAQEGERWIMTLVGYDRSRPPGDDAGFVEYTRGYPTQDLYDLVRSAEPLCDPITATFPANQRRRYERLTRFPGGFLVIGDAICSFNPMYGQGMSVAAAEAEALAACCQEGLDGLALRFFRRSAEVVDIAWALSAQNDSRLLNPQADRSARTRFLQWYMARLHVAARRDPQAALAFLSVVGLLAPPSSVLRPRMALRVLRGGRFRPVEVPMRPG
jgi:2-polyprenyl-6-methoxyphenol hydroxylase-like FAD-dependent oxidoreductase